MLKEIQVINKFLYLRLLLPLWEAHFFFLFCILYKPSDTSNSDVEMISVDLNVDFKDKK